MELLRAMSRASQSTLIVVTHDARIFGYADRIAHMDDGRVVRLETSEPAVLETKEL
jgi:putative ABC transport system ATP-binding protein